MPHLIPVFEYKIYFMNSQQAHTNVENVILYRKQTLFLKISDIQIQIRLRFVMTN